MLFQGEKDMREMLGEGPFYKELGIYKYNREFLRKMLQTIMHIGIHISGILGNHLQRSLHMGKNMYESEHGNMHTCINRGNRETIHKTC